MRDLLQGERAAGDPLRQRALMHTTMLVIYGAGSTLYLVSYLIASAWRPQLALLGVDAAAYVGFFTLLATRGRLSEATLEGFEWVAYGLITAVIVLGDASASTFGLFYLWVSLHAAYFRPPRRLALHVAGVAALFGCALGFGAAGFDAVRWLMVCGTVGTVAGLVATLKRWVDRLVGGLTDAAHTDALTGLGNRRALLSDAPAVFANAGRHPAALLLFDLNGFKAYNDTFGHPAGDALLRRLGECLVSATPPNGKVYRMGGDEFCVLVTADAAELPPIVAATRAALSEAGEGFAIDAAHGLALIPGEAGTLSEALGFADRELYRQKTSRRDGGDQALDVLLCALAARDPDLHRHASEVAALADRVARRLGMAAHDLTLLAKAAALHDVGKIAIPDSILAKPGPLTAAERQFVERHAQIGERILSQAPPLAPAGRIVRAHHERWDGTGYPDGLTGEAIPLAARVIAVCDAWEAMRSDRPYRRSRAEADALDELRRCAGGQFDPAVVAAFESELTTAQDRASAASR